jgi:phospholipid transport system transporter-binding protein
MTAALKLPAVASLDQAPALLRDVDAALAAAGAQALQVDASALTEFDTSAVALLLHAQREAHARGTVLRVVGAPPKLRELARLYGVEELLPLDGPPAPT